MKEFTKENLPKRNGSIKRLLSGTFVMKVSAEEYYACKKAQNGGVFVDACKNIIKYNKGREKAEKVVKFESEETTLNYLNNVKTKDFKKKLEEDFFSFTGDVIVWGSPTVILAYTEFLSSRTSSEDAENSFRVFGFFFADSAAFLRFLCF